MSGAAELHFDAVLRALAAVTEEPGWSQRLHELGATRDRRLHVAVMHEPYLTLLLEGKKTVESRFSLKRVQPFRRVFPGDILALKRQSGPMVGLALVGAAHFYELDPALFQSLRSRYEERLAATDESFWHERRRAAYATMIEVHHPQRLPAVLLRKRDRRGWATLQPRGI